MINITAWEPGKELAELKATFSEAEAAKAAEIAKAAMASQLAEAVDSDKQVTDDMNAADAETSSETKDEVVELTPDKFETESTDVTDKDSDRKGVE
jgi:hypothetical protein